MLLRVEMEAWAIGCCVPVPVVGERVSWQLAWGAGDEGPSSAETAWTDVERYVPARYEAPPFLVGWTLRSGDVTAWSSQEVLAGVPLRGSLWHEAHGAVPVDLPPTAGVVRRVQVVLRTFRWVDDRLSEPVPALYRLTDGPLRGRSAWTGVGRGVPYEDETGVLVTLETARG